MDHETQPLNLRYRNRKKIRDRKVRFVTRVYTFLLLTGLLSWPAKHCSFGCESTNDTTSSTLLSPQQAAMLTDTIAHIAADYDGEIGVALILNGSKRKHHTSFTHDTITLNDRSVYPMMSVFKMHQAIALCSVFDHTGTPLDTVVSVKISSLDPNTWSPMLKDYIRDSENHPDAEISPTVGELLRYSLIQSDNNASNLLFNRIVNTSVTDSLIATIIPRRTFQIAFTEEVMAADHSKAYDNYTSPLGAAMLINRLFTDSILSADKETFITKALSECTTGTDRIVAPLASKKGITVAHKTGSGYSSNGILAAHNDVAYIMLPDGTSYSLAIFVKDISAPESTASEAIARISAAVYDLLCHN